jgi:hypothetical protein
VLVYSCTPEDGTNGIDGTNGTNGTAGTNGTNGQGFDELAKYGSISTTLTGKRPDGVAFTQETKFKFTPTEYPGNANAVSKNGNDLYFNLKRFLATPDSQNHDDESFSRLSLNVTDAGLPTRHFELNTTLNSLSIISSDLKYFTLWNSWSSNDTAITNFTVPSYSYNDQTKNLKFTFSYTVAADSNDTRNDLTVTGSVDVIVLEEIQYSSPL